MKKENLSNHKTNFVIADHNIHEFPKEIQAAYQYLNANENEVLFPEKYYQACKTALKGSLIKTLNETPEKPLKEIVADSIKTFPDFIPSDKILELTMFIIQIYEAQKKKLSSELAAG